MTFILLTIVFIFLVYKLGHMDNTLRKQKREIDELKSLVKVMIQQQNRKP